MIFEEMLINNLNEENKKLRQQLACKEKTIHNLLTETQDLKKVLQNISDKLIAENSNLKASVQKLEEERREVSKEIEKYQQLSPDKTDWMAEYHVLTETIKELSYENIELEKQLAEKDLRIEELESQFAYECECNKQFVECQNENEMLKQQLTDKEKEMKGENQIMPPDIEFVDIVYNLLKNNINNKTIILIDDVIYIPMKDKEVKIEITKHEYKGE